MHFSDIELFFDCAPDYSEHFTQKVAEIAKDLSQEARIKVQHNPDMNYTYSQSLRIFFKSNKCEPSPSGYLAKYEFRILLSSKGPLYCTLVLSLDSLSHWRLCDIINLPVCIKEYEDIVVSVLSRYQYKKVDQDLLWKQLNGRFDELDGSPSTVFSVLFTEIL